MRFTFLSFLLSLFISNLSAQEYLVKSPDGELKVEVVVSANTIYRVYHRGKLLMHGKPIGLKIGKENYLGKKEFRTKEATTSVNRTVNPIVPYRSAEIKENYNQLSLDFESGLVLEFRCFDEGFAYRLKTTFEREVKIEEENMGFELTGNPNVWFPKESSFNSHNERKYTATTSMDLKKGTKGSLPILWKRENGPFILFTETDLRDYPGMYLQ